MDNITGYHQSAHFKVNDLIVYFRMTPPSDFLPCHHIEGLYCSKASEFSPEDCKKVRKCELLEWKEKLFKEFGIHGPTLMELDMKLRSS